MHDCASILDSIAKGISLLFFAWCIPSLHPHSFNEIIFELVQHIFDG